MLRNLLSGLWEELKACYRHVLTAASCIRYHCSASHCISHLPHSERYLPHLSPLLIFFPQAIFPAFFFPPPLCLYIPVFMPCSNSYPNSKTFPRHLVLSLNPPASAKEESSIAVRYWTQIPASQCYSSVCSNQNYSKKDVTITCLPGTLHGPSACLPKR